MTSRRTGARPALIGHADWSVDPGKRWISIAQREGRQYVVAGPEPVGDVASLLARLTRRAGGGPIVVGFDFPIGLPVAHARRAGIEKFLDALPRFGTGAWAAFYDLALTPGEIAAGRPFYPGRAGGTRHAHLVAGLGVSGMRDLLRECDRAADGRRAACCLFWTLGGQQVGRATIAGWRDLLAPALARGAGEVGIWPFHGSLAELIARCRIVVVESYPAEACVHLGLTPPGRGWSKRRQADRQARAAPLLGWAARRDVVLVDRVRAAIEQGFGRGADGEDRFDSMVGLMSMIEVVLGHRPDGAPDRPAVRDVEGWVLGRLDPPVAAPSGVR